MTRIFISVPVSNATGLSTFYQELSRVKGVSVSPVYQLHITLAFLGEVPEDRLEDIYAVADGAVRGRIGGRIRLKGAGCFPNTKHPSVVWVGVESDVDLAGISADLRTGLKRIGISCDGKPFIPHVTVGRVKGEPRIQILMNKYRSEEFASVLCNDIRVMGSTLTPQGAQHKILHVSYLD